MAESLAAYLSNQWGFSESGRVLIGRIQDRIEKRGILVLNPFEECGKELDVRAVEKMDSYKDRLAYWRNFSEKVTPINNELMKRANIFLGIFDGGACD